MSTLKNEISKIESFLKNYREVIESFDAKKIAENYELPFQFVSDNVLNVYSTSDKLEEILNQYLDQYKLLSIRRANFEVLEIVKLTSLISVIKVKWDFYYPNMEKVYDCEYVYTIRYNEQRDAYRIISLVAVNEYERMQSLLRKSA